MKLLIIFDPHDDDTPPHFERTQHGVKCYVDEHTNPVGLYVHEHRVGDDADTIVAILNGAFTWPEPIAAWRVNGKNRLVPLEKPERDTTSEIQAAEAARGA